MNQGARGLIEQARDQWLRAVPGRVLEHSIQPIQGTTKERHQVRLNASNLQEPAALGIGPGYHEALNEALVEAKFRESRGGR
jgi:hypothetical protein